MSLKVYETSAGLFIHGLTNLKTLLKQGEAHAAANGTQDLLLNAALAAQGGTSHPHDVHAYTLAAQVHWAAEGAKLAVAHLLDVKAAPDACIETSFQALYQRLDATIAFLREVEPAELEASIDRVIVIKVRLGSLQFSGSQFLLEYAIPHFHYHVSAAYGILRNQGVQLTMGDFLGNAARRV